MISAKELDALVDKKVKHRVKCTDTGIEDKEYGLIIYAWHDNTLDAVDYYVTF